MAYDRPKFDLKEQPKSKGWLLDQLSTAGGIGSSLGGAALGTAILPGIGTLIGGALGGALGSGAGEAGENIITGDELGRNVGKEALMGGVFGTPLLRGAKGVVGASKALLTGAGGKAANQALQSTLKVGTGAVARGATKGAVNLATNTGKNIVSDVLGIKTGAKIAGKGILKPQYIDDLGNFVSKQVTGKAPNAADVLIKTQNYADDIGKSIAKKIGSSKVIVNGADISGDVVKNLQKNLLPTDDAVVTGVLNRLKTAKTPSELWELRKIMDDKISWIANPDAATSNMNSIAHSIRDTLSKSLEKVGLKDLNKQYGLAQDAIKLLQKPAISPKGINILGNNIGGDLAQRGTIASGRGLEAVGNMAGRTVGNIPQIPQGLVGAITRQAGGRALTGMSQGVEQPMGQSMQMGEIQSGTPSLFRQQAFGEQPTAQMDGQMGQIPQSNPFGVSSEQIGQALMMALMSGDSASAGQLQQMLELSQMFGGGQEQKEYSSVIAGNISDFNSSLSELGQLEQMISGGAGTTDPILGRLRSINPYDTEQQTLQAAIDKTRQLVGKALEGGVLRKEDEEKYKKILPTTADSRQVAINKISMIRSQLEAKLQDYSSLVGAGGGSMEDIIMNQMRSN